MIRSLTPFPTVYEGALWLLDCFKVCTQVQAGRFYHARNILGERVCVCVCGGGGDGGESLYFPDRENLPGRPPSDHKMVKK